METAFGEVVGGALPDGLTLPTAIAAWRATARRTDYKVVEARRSDDRDGYAETLIVDCESDDVPTRNRVGIQYRERLGLTFHRDSDRLPEVHALRDDFPIALHQNDSSKGTPRSLCIWFEPWPALRRTWTPEKHLDRIRWWLAETANGTLHRPDQPLEQLYFEGSFELVFPHDFAERCDVPGYHLAVEPRQGRNQRRVTLIGRMVQAGGAPSANTDFPCLTLSIPPTVHGPIEVWPDNLGELHDQLERRGGSLAKPLVEAIKARCINGNFPNFAATRTLLVLRLPLLREAGGEVERVDEMGFVAEVRMGDLGVSIGALDKTDRGYWSVPHLGGEAQERHEWRAWEITPLAIVHGFTPHHARRACGLPDAGPTGVIAGVGALGGEIVDLWSRSGWGQWTIIDPDRVSPHNLARSHAVECHIGLSKVDVVKGLADLLTPGQPSRVTAIADRASVPGSEEIRRAIEAANLVVDVTTTLEFPRDLAFDAGIRRAVSVFITPSGRGAVMLLEDAERAVRLDSLEAQYYRHVISRPWGREHLAGNWGHLWVGAGCRDISVIIPNELIGIHGANLAAMIRVHAAQPDAKLVVWHYDMVKGSLAADRCTLAAPITTSMDGLTIVWDRKIRQKIRSQRRAHLPNETGGVLLGHVDQVSKRIFIVDALPAPLDSEEEPTGFVRGIEGLAHAVQEARRRTANIVGYLGEWHSHPRHHSSAPSPDDLKLLGHLAEEMMHEGQPVLMLIVGEREENWLAARGQ